MVTTESPQVIAFKYHIWYTFMEVHKYHIWYTFMEVHKYHIWYTFMEVHKYHIWYTFMELHFAEQDVFMMHRVVFREKNKSSKVAFVDANLYNLVMSYCDIDLGQHWMR